MPPVLERAKCWFRDKVFEPVQEWLKSGAEPTILACSTGVGFSLGLCPLPGVSTLLCLGALGVAKLAKKDLHTAMALLANFLAVPAEVALILMHMRVGEFVLRAPHLEAVHISFTDLLSGDLAVDLLYGLGHAIAGWLVLLPFWAAAAGYGTLPLFKFLKKKLDPFPHQPLTSSEGFEGEEFDEELDFENAHPLSDKGAGSTQAGTTRRGVAPLTGAGEPQLVLQHQGRQGVRASIGSGGRLRSRSRSPGARGGSFGPDLL